MLAFAFRVLNQKSDILLENKFEEIPVSNLFSTFASQLKSIIRFQSSSILAIVTTKYVMLAEDPSILDESVPNGLKDTYSSLSAPVGINIQIVQAMKEITGMKDIMYISIAAIEFGRGDVKAAASSL